MLKKYFYRSLIFATVLTVVYACADNSDVEKSQENSIDRSIEEVERIGDVNSMTHELGTVKKEY